MCSREAIKKMLRQKENRDGTGDYSIINISSVHESTPMPLAPSLCCLKRRDGNAHKDIGLGGSG